MMEFLRGFLEWFLGTAAVLAVIGLFVFLWELACGRVYRPKPVDPKTVSALRKELRQAQGYCWRLERAEGRRRSHLGGVPYMAPGRPWPRSVERSLSFVAQINLRDLRSKDGPDWLPEAGLLLFFVDVEADRWAVIHEPDTKVLRAAEEPADLPTEHRRVLRYKEKPVYFSRRRSWPGYQRLKTKASAEEDDAARASLQIFERADPVHQVGGYPDCVQGDWMEWELEMDARGIRPKSFGDWLETPEAAAMEPAVREWKLLLQIDSDEDTGFHWVDSGVLYFWIREQDAREGNFAATKMIAQFC